MSNFVLACGLLSVCVGDGAPERLDVPLEYRRYPDEEDYDSPYLYRGERDLVCLAAPPAGDWKLPALVGERPIFAVASLGDEERLFILDRETAQSPSYDRLWCDTDGDRDLTDETPVAAADGLYAPGLFESLPLDLTLRVDGSALPYSLHAVAFSEEMMEVLIEGEEYTEPIDLEEFTFTLKGDCCYAGAFELQGQAWQVLLGDADLNGRFGDTFAYARHGELKARRALETVGDVLLLAAGRAPEELDAGRLGSQLGIGGELYRVAVEGGGALLTLEPLAGELGAVRLSFEPERLLLVSEDQREQLTLLRPGREVAVPPGRYRVAGYQLYRADEWGDSWFLSAAATPRSTFATVSAGATLDLPCGEPFSPEATIPPSEYEAFSRLGLDRVQIEFSILGSGNEIVNDIRHVEGHATQIPLDYSGAFPTEPSFRVFLPTGQIVASGTFEYG